MVFNPVEVLKLSDNYSRRDAHEPGESHDLVRVKTETQECRLELGGNENACGKPVGFLFFFRGGHFSSF